LFIFVQKAELDAQQRKEGRGGGAGVGGREYSGRAGRFQGLNGGRGEKMSGWAENCS
jgi:hypothetical protein